MTTLPKGMALQVKRVNNAINEIKSAKTGKAKINASLELAKQAGLTVVTPVIFAGKFIIEHWYLLSLGLKLPKWKKHEKESNNSVNETSPEPAAEAAQNAISGEVETTLTDSNSTNSTITLTDGEVNSNIVTSDVVTSPMMKKQLFIQDGDVMTPVNKDISIKDIIKNKKSILPTESDTVVLSNDVASGASNLLNEKQMFIQDGDVMTPVNKDTSIKDIIKNKGTSDTNIESNNTSSNTYEEVAESTSVVDDVINEEIKDSEIETIEDVSDVEKSDTIVEETKNSTNQESKVSEDIIEAAISKDGALRGLVEILLEFLPRYVVTDIVTRIVSGKPLAEIIHVIIKYSGKIGKKTAGYLIRIIREYFNNKHKGPPGPGGDGGGKIIPFHRPIHPIEPVTTPPDDIVVPDDIVTADPVPVTPVVPVDIAPVTIDTVPVTPVEPVDTIPVTIDSTPVTPVAPSTAPKTGPSVGTNHDTVNQPNGGFGIDTSGLALGALALMGTGQAASEYWPWIRLGGGMFIEKERTLMDSPFLAAPSY